MADDQSPAKIESPFTASGPVGFHKGHGAIVVYVFSLAALMGIPVNLMPLLFGPVTRTFHVDLTQLGQMQSLFLAGGILALSVSGYVTELIREKRSGIIAVTLIGVGSLLLATATNAPSTNATVALGRTADLPGPPELTLPGTQMLLADNTLRIVGIEIGEANSAKTPEPVKVSLKVLKGTLTFSHSVASGLRASSIAGNGTPAVSVTCLPEEFNATLAEANGLTYRADQSVPLTMLEAINGPQSRPDTLLVQVTRAAESSAENRGSVVGSLSLVAADSAPGAVPGLTIPRAESISPDTTIPFPSLTLADSVPTDEAGDLRVVLEVTDGVLVVDDQIEGGLTSDDIHRNGHPSVELIGSVAAINRTLSNPGALTYQGGDDSQGQGSLTIHIASEENSHRGFFFILLAAFTLGMGIQWILSVYSLVITTQFGDSRQKMFMWTTAAFAAGAAIGNAMMGYLLAHVPVWNLIFLAFPIVIWSWFGALFFLFGHRLATPRPRTKPGVSPLDGGENWLRRTRMFLSSGLFNRGTLWMLALLVVLDNLAAGGIITWTGRFLQKVHGIGDDQVAYLLSAVALGVFVGRMLMGAFVSGRFSDRMVLGSTYAGGVLAYILILLTPNYTVILALIFLLGALIGAQAPTMYSLASEKFGDRAATAIPLVDAIGNLGGFLGPAILGTLALHYGLGAVLWILPVIGGLFVSLVFIWEWVDRMREARPAIPIGQPAREES